jgi:hypothetical protein
LVSSSPPCSSRTHNSSVTQIKLDDAPKRVRPRRRTMQNGTAMQPPLFEQAHMHLLRARIVTPCVKHASIALSSLNSPTRPLNRSNR